MKQLLVASALFELGAGLVLGFAPSVLSSLLFGAPLDPGAGLTVGRLTGAALLSLAVACGMASRDARSRAARGVVAAMLVYNVAAVACLLYARIGLALSGVALWPAVVLHAALAVWCFAGVMQRNDHDRLPRSGSAATREDP